MALYDRTACPLPFYVSCSFLWVEHGRLGTGLVAGGLPFDTRAGIRQHSAAFGGVTR